MRDACGGRDGHDGRHSRSVKTMAVFSAMVFVIMTVTMLLTGAAIVTLGRLRLIGGDPRGITILMFAVVSVIVGTLLSRLIGKRPIDFIVDINEATKKVSAGDFDVTIDEDGIPATELREMAHNFNVMTGELAGIEILRNDFVENVSHEFKTPIAAIEGYATLLQRRELSEEKRLEYADRILVNATRLSSLTGNILLLSRLDHQRIEAARERFSLDEQIREALLLLEPQWSARGIALDVDLDAVDYVGNAELLEQVWLNLIGNAVKFTADGGTVGVRLRVTGRQVRVGVSDDGPGMDEATMRRIYDRFYQADASRATAGNGLGLTIAKRIVDLHHGTIDVDSSPGAGSTFTVTLPLHESSKV
ncbi:HAMP domain-containing histidine kinase [Bifidobacterium amazonense]|uniref:histidine kinase n=1 Tax=Bifidobacterium amazonense TaxID=2809027 RepID=A0ABS9VU53_9BIFI|nr:HAMP domain-containing sensor histidine kinase [Bifidobacterium amazonense]MCH9275628.1 HAMP domain-containing histidine kinase [Bifidobacterium amazonense]